MVTMCFPDGTVVKNPPVKAGDEGDTCSIPRSGRSPGGGHGNPFQYSCLGYPMDRGVCWVSLVGHKKSDRTEDSCMCQTLFSVFFLH